MRRIAVTGSSGSGKSTLAGEVSRRLGVPHVELDALHWDPHWTAATPHLLRERADAALPADGGWVVDGNYRQLRDITWSRADTVLWLDYSLPFVFWRLTKRCLWRGLARVELYNGNRERLWEHLLTRDSLLLYLLKTHRQRRLTTEADLAKPEYAHLNVHRFRNVAETRSWLAGLSPWRPG